mmetsp:Transcript_82858/g.130579  ORF Transcript_82858/g.130579 Transcript_82858/m.130579 type:complete len:265 (-) Transcript_82858:41-835(-)
MAMLSEIVSVSCPCIDPWHSGSGVAASTSGCSGACVTQMLRCYRARLFPTAYSCSYPQYGYLTAYSSNLDDFEQYVKILNEVGRTILRRFCEEFSIHVERILETWADQELTEEDAAYLIQVHRLMVLLQKLREISPTRMTAIAPNLIVTVECVIRPASLTQETAQLECRSINGDVMASFALHLSETTVGELYSAFLPQILKARRLDMRIAKDFNCYSRAEFETHYGKDWFCWWVEAWPVLCDVHLVSQQGDLLDNMDATLADVI